MSSNRKESIGALWIRNGSSGEFLSGKITINGKETEIIAFVNTYKQEGEKTPDWRIFISEPRNASPTQKPAGKPKAVVNKKKAPLPSPEDEFGGAEEVDV
jgi:hypothetical protein